MSSVRSQVGLALRTRLASITAANSYPIEIKQVYYDKIPLGLELTPEDLPALFLLDDGADTKHLHGVIEVARQFRVQIVDQEDSTDDRMNELIRLVAKAVWANSATAEVQDQFRSIHERIYQVEMVGDETDLHMIEGNRIASTQMIVHYRTRPYDL